MTNCADTDVGHELIVVVVVDFSGARCAKSDVVASTAPGIVVFYAGDRIELPASERCEAVDAAVETKSES